MTRVARPAPRGPAEGSKFEGKQVMLKKSEIEEIKSRSKQQKGMDRRGATADFKQMRSERRRAARIHDREKNHTCYLCRETGHNVKNCPKATGDNAVGICYHCGSSGHTTKRCRAPKRNFKFAKCYVCGEQGHLSSACKQNDKGLYPNGGGCKYCGSTQHLAWQCKPTRNRGLEATIGTVDLSQGGDDDDVFVALHRQQVDKAKRKAHAEDAPSAPAPAAPKKVKVVNF